ncbi:MAG: YicC/YloC family endoribonuclease [Thermovirgaceae bacterium]|nr:YicC family protein [Synergistales bacterium]HPC76117.1 YicC family protein [Synergistales bacterium]HRS48794.1 YicC family protein [Thermovirgaceae bacterium]HRU90998.1 YicC family protein [Thermovirgaceae bacterium]
MKSMTGFSRVEEKGDLCSTTLEISSLNHRNQEITVRLPRELSHLEPLVQQSMRASSRRGKIQVRIDITWDPAANSSRIEPEILKGYVKELDRIRQELGMKGELDLGSLLSLPGVLSAREMVTPELEDILGEAVRNVLEKGIKEWDSMRMKEGSHLKEAILHSLERYQETVRVIREKWSLSRDRALEAQKERVRQILEINGAVVDENRVAQEIVLAADKWDITEELARSSSHVDKFLGLVHNDEVSGKTLDFLLQEMNREVNTIASKVQDSEVRWLVVEAKGFLERIRELVQNVE